MTSTARGARCVDMERQCFRIGVAMRPACRLGQGPRSYPTAANRPRPSDKIRRCPAMHCQWTDNGETSAPCHEPMIQPKRLSSLKFLVGRVGLEPTTKGL